jgi:hypothetical protein
MVWYYDVIFSRVGGYAWRIMTILDRMNVFIGTWVAISLNYKLYNAIAILHTFQFTAAHALGFSVSTSRCLVADLNIGTIASSHYEVFLPFLGTADSLNSVLQRFDSPILSPVWSSLLVANTLSFYGLGILLTYIDAAWTRITENTSRAIQPVHWPAGCCQEKLIVFQLLQKSPAIMKF